MPMNIVILMYWLSKFMITWMIVRFYHASKNCCHWNCSTSMVRIFSIWCCCRKSKCPIFKQNSRSSVKNIPLVKNIVFLKIIITRFLKIWKQLLKSQVQNHVAGTTFLRSLKFLCVCVMLKNWLSGKRRQINTQFITYNRGYVWHNQQRSHYYWP